MMSDNVFLPPLAAQEASGGAQLQMATLGVPYSNRGWTLILEGQNSATTKAYKVLQNVGRLRSGDRVLVVKVSGTYIILGKPITDPQVGGSS